MNVFKAFLFIDYEYTQRRSQIHQPWLIKKHPCEEHNKIQITTTMKTFHLLPLDTDHDVVVCHAYYFENGAFNGFVCVCVFYSVACYFIHFFFH